MSHLPQPQKTEGNVKEVTVSDMSVEELLSDILKELKIMNLHLSSITDMLIEPKDIQEE